MPKFQSGQQVIIQSGKFKNQPASILVFNSGNGKWQVQLESGRRRHYKAANLAPADAAVKKDDEQKEKKEEKKGRPDQNLCPKDRTRVTPRSF